MHLCKSFVAHSKTMEIMEPSMSTFDYPSIFSKATAMLGAALCKKGFDAPITQFLPVCFGVVCTIGVDGPRLFQRAPVDTTDGWNRVNERQQLGEVMTMCAGQDDRERHPICVGSNMVLRAWSRTIYGVRPSFWPAPIARTEDESTITREKSIWPAARNSPSSSSCNRSHTPASRQSRNRRQQVTPEPQPISAGRSRQRSPVRNTNKMPLNAARSGTGLRPGYFSRRGFGCGSKGSIRSHNSSSMIGLSISLTSSLRRPRLIYGHPHFCNTDFGVWMACSNLSGVVVRSNPRASMRIAPGGLGNSCSFRSSLTFQDVRRAVLPFTSSIISSRKTRWVDLLKPLAGCGNTLH